MSLTEDRVGRITGSRIASILGLSPYATPESVLREMVRQALGADTEFRGNIATEHGNANETRAFELYEQRYGVMCEQHDTKVHPALGFLAHSPDGLVGDDGMVEVKCPFRAGYRTIAERPDYEQQIRLGLEVFDREWCDFVVFDGQDIYVDRVERDMDWLPSVLPALTDFMETYQEVVSDPEKAAPYLEPLKDVRSDDEWTQAAMEWLEAKYAKDLADERLAKAKRDLVNLAPDKPATGAGVQVVHKRGRKTTAWARFAKEHGLEPGDSYVTETPATVEVRRAAG